MTLEYRHEQSKNDFPNDEPLTRKRNLTFVLLLRHSYLALVKPRRFEFLKHRRLTEPIKALGE